ncbi:MAG: hypothetical protein ACYTG0_03685 [Planctomycetota bacterium]|jgi:hypothetical protein
MFRITNLLVLVSVVLAIQVHARESGAEPAATAWQAGWPHKVGPQGNLQPLESDTSLVEDLALARLAWVSETAALGTAKTGSQTFRYPMGRPFRSRRYHQRPPPETVTNVGIRLRSRG